MEVSQKTAISSCSQFSVHWSSILSILICFSRSHLEKVHNMRCWSFMILSGLPFAFIDAWYGLRSARRARWYAKKRRQHLTTMRGVDMPRDRENSTQSRAVIKHTNSTHQPKNRSQQIQFNSPAKALVLLVSIMQWKSVCMFNLQLMISILLRFFVCVWSSKSQRANFWHFYYSSVSNSSSRLAAICQEPACTHSHQTRINI